ncbi:MAG: hypothetical protein KF716_22390 [Anaerolineae bacterium]|nr:hypothetical protein [Anaerolineae bacterium]
MSQGSSVPAVIAYLPILGWLYVYLFQRKNSLALFHLRQSIGLFLFLLGVFVGWVVLAYVLALVPYMAVISVSLFAIVIAAYIFGVVAWVMGILNALKQTSTPLPFFGRWATRLPIT